ncbi:nudix hydrolase 2 [Ricinus communis]|uniref:Mutt domain protein, putative n=1 Tax=Ricinus communis TaxID=3988 RepID=B9SWR2_RICCO|nr:nudix hydrolase 2 [Ricinus communis]EEF31962.1 mutt domain protein, putative [Ricinus communis]|eukprot:XP_002530431.1 nudix hydrolase 2 [Ricinus communis]
MSASLSSTPAMVQGVAESEVKQMKLLAAINDGHEGVIVELSEPMSSEVFGSMLKASLAHWRKQGKRGVWIKVPIEFVNLVEAAVKEGFWYHHAEPKYLMLVYWIPEGTHTLPANATHRVGVGAFVMNENREVLVVQEKNGIFRGMGVWKFPTGVVDEGEDIWAAAVREVKEETAIETTFIEVLAFRQSHKAFFGKSDLFFLCLLQPLSFDITKQESEIEAAQWMPLEEYLAQPFVQKNQLVRQINDICLTKLDKTYSGFSPLPATSNRSDEKSYLYLNAGDMKWQ